MLNENWAGLRRSGRTTRMLTYILISALQGPSHYTVVGADGHHVSHLRDAFRDLLGYHNVTFLERMHRCHIVIGASSVEFVEHVDRRGRCETVIFEDHHAIECRIGKDLSELSRWDVDMNYRRNDETHHCNNRS